VAITHIDKGKNCFSSINPDNMGDKSEVIDSKPITGLPSKYKQYKQFLKNEIK